MDRRGVAWSGVAGLVAGGRGVVEEGAAGRRGVEGWRRECGGWGRAWVARMRVAAARVNPSRTFRGMRVMREPMRDTPRRKRMTPTCLG